MADTKYLNGWANAARNDRLGGPTLSKGLENLRNAIGAAPTPAPDSEDQMPSAPAPRTPDVRSAAEAQANYDRIHQNLAQGLPPLAGIGQPDMQPAPAASPAMQAKMQALQKMGAAQQAPPDLGPGFEDVSANPNMQPAVPSPVGSAQDPNVQRAIQRARQQEQEDDE